MTLKLLYLFLFLIFSTFFYWKRLREDYPLNTVFSSALISYLGLTAGYFVAYYFFSNLVFWMSFLGFVIASFFSIFFYKIKLLEGITAFCQLAILLFTFLYGYLSLIQPQVFNMVNLAVGTVGLITFLIIDRYYKNFSWYRSGVVGLSGFVCLGVFFLIRGTIALFDPSVISFVGINEAIISYLIVFLSVYLIFRLARLNK